MVEIASELKSKSLKDGSSTIVALKTYLTCDDMLIYKILVVQDSQLIDESKKFKDKTDAEICFKYLQELYL